MALILDLAVPSGRLPSRPNRPLVGAASLSLVLHLVLVSLALLAWASRGGGQSAVAKLLSAEKLIRVGDGASGGPRGGAPQQREARRESSHHHHRERLERLRATTRLHPTAPSNRQSSWSFPRSRNHRRSATCPEVSLRC